jgi:hypothetical protein
MSPCWTVPDNAYWGQSGQFYSSIEPNVLYYNSALNGVSLSRTHFWTTTKIIKTINTLWIDISQTCLKQTVKGPAKISCFSRGLFCPDKIHSKNVRNYISTEMHVLAGCMFCKGACFTKFDCRCQIDIDKYEQLNNMRLNQWIVYTC